MKRRQPRNIQDDGTLPDRRDLRNAEKKRFFIASFYWIESADGIEIRRSRGLGNSPVGLIPFREVADYVDRIRAARRKKL